MPNDRVKKIFKFFMRNNQTLCIAESCTGGLISSLITDVPGASRFFLGSVVSYTNVVKIQQLKVPKKLLDQKGAVNREVAEFMAKGVKSLLKGDWSISITGLMDSGLVFSAVYDGQNVHVSKAVFSGLNREETKYQSALFCFDCLITELSKRESVE